MEESTMYQPVRVGRGVLSEQVAHQIVDLIANNQLRVGDRLPPLEELGHASGVSRTAVREAIKLLDAWGVVTVKHGVGTFVAGLPEHALEVPFRLSAERSSETFAHLHQLRVALEPDIAALAARKAQPEQIAEMEAAILRMDRALGDPESYIPADVAFHTALAKATGNELFLLVIRPVIDLLADAMRLSEQTQGATSRGQAFHRTLLEHIKAGDAERAAEAMRAHLDQVWYDIVAQLDDAGL